MPYAHDASPASWSAGAACAELVRARPERRKQPDDSVVDEGAFRAAETRTVLQLSQWYHGSVRSQHLTAFGIIDRMASAKTEDELRMLWRGSRGRMWGAFNCNNISACEMIL